MNSTAIYVTWPMLIETPAVDDFLAATGSYGMYTVFNQSTTANHAPKRLELIIFNIPRGKHIYWTSCWPTGECQQWRVIIMPVALLSQHISLQPATSGPVDSLHQ
jgi:hypothetical protein